MTDKRTISQPIDYDFSDWDGTISIQQLREELNELQQKGATHINIETEMGYAYATLSITAHIEREETDQERVDRIRAAQLYENIQQQLQKDRELELLKVLKAKYEQ
jgi:hypothetical protein